METIMDITALSSRGQLVLPKSIRETLSLNPGARFMVLTDGDNILLKPIKKPEKKEFDKLLNTASKWASEVGMTEDDITDAIKEVRSRRRPE